MLTVIRLQKKRKQLAEIERKLINHEFLTRDEEKLIDIEFKNELIEIKNENNERYKCVVTKNLYDVICPTKEAQRRGETMEKRTEILMNGFMKEKNKTEALWFNFSLMFNIFGSKSIQPLRIRTHIDNKNHLITFDLA